jgi:hypothetical protein
MFSMDWIDDTPPGHAPVFSQTIPIKITLKIKATARLIHIGGTP